MQAASWYRIFVGYTLLTLLSVPTFMPAIHEILDYHAHHHCVTKPWDHHLHADHFGCELCDYLSSFQMPFDDVTLTLASEIPRANPDMRNVSYGSLPEPGSAYLRGPPTA